MNNILIVDDEIEIRELIKTAIEDRFSDVLIETANDGLEAYAKCHSKKFELIITDHKMPYCTGLNFINKMRDAENPNISSPIIVVSGFIPEIEDKISSLDNLFYLSKPFKLDRLINYCKMTMNTVN